MNETGFVRRAVESDVDDIYSICCKVELCDKSHADGGFLLTQSSAHPKFKEDVLENIIEKEIFVYSERGQVLGFLIGYSLDKWKQMRGGLKDDAGNDFRWYPEVLSSLGIQDIHSLDSAVAYMDKIAVDPSALGRGIGSKIIKYFSQESLNKGMDYLLSKIVEGVFKDDENLGLTNGASISFHHKIGSRKAGESGIYTRPNTFFGSDARFKTGVYIGRTKEILSSLQGNDNQKKERKRYYSTITVPFEPKMPSIYPTVPDSSKV